MRDCPYCAPTTCHCGFQAGYLRAQTADTTTKADTDALWAEPAPDGTDPARYRRGLTAWAWDALADAFRGIKTAMTRCHDVCQDVRASDILA